jgi:glycine cleavage system H protein
MKYTQSHEWITLNGSVATVGVSQFAQKELGDIVYLELPQIGRQVKKGEEIAVLESTKAAADVYSPVSGKIIGVNQNLSESPELVNQDPESTGWLFRIELTHPSEMDHLMTAEAYQQLIRST